MRNIDTAMCNNFCFTESILIENAGIFSWQLLYNTIVSQYTSIPSILFIIGSGNNAADALVIARLAHIQQYPVHIILAHDTYNKNVQEKLSILQKLSIPISHFTDCYQQLPHIIDTHHIVIDGLCGTGITRPITKDSQYGKLLTVINTSSLYRIALDIPSGICTEAHTHEHIWFQAQTTLSLGFYKIEHFLLHTRFSCGTLINISIGFPSLSEIQKIITIPHHYLLCNDDIPQFLPNIAPYAHKYNRGIVYSFTGSVAYTGAALLCAYAAQHSFASMVHMYCDANIYDYIMTKANPSLLITQVSHNIDEQTEFLSILQKKLEKYEHSACIIGCGWGETNRHTLITTLITSTICGVIDADALEPWHHIMNTQSIHPPKQWIITPHIAEFSRMLTIPIMQLSHNPIYYIKEYAKKYYCIVVLKGYLTYITNGTQVYILDAINPSLAVAGSGDILAGIIAGLLSCGLSSLDASIGGVLLHSYAGAYCHKKYTYYTAEKLINAITHAIKEHYHE